MWEEKKWKENSHWTFLARLARKIYLHGFLLYYLIRNIFHHFLLHFIILFYLLLCILSFRFLFLSGQKKNVRQVLRIPLQEQDEYASYKAQFITDNKIFLLLLFHIFSRRAKDKLRIVEEKILVLWRFFYCRKILLPDSWRIFCLEIYSKL